MLFRPNNPLNYLAISPLSTLPSAGTSSKPPANLTFVKVNGAIGRPKHSIVSFVTRLSGFALEGSSKCFMVFFGVLVLDFRSISTVDCWDCKKKLRLQPIRLEELYRLVGLPELSSLSNWRIHLKYSSTPSQAGSEGRMSGLKRSIFSGSFDAISSILASCFLLILIDHVCNGLGGFCKLLVRPSCLLLSSPIPESFLFVPIYRPSRNDSLVVSLHPRNKR